VIKKIFKLTEKLFDQTCKLNPHYSYTLSISALIFSLIVVIPYCSGTTVCPQKGTVPGEGKESVKKRFDRSMPRRQSGAVEEGITTARWGCGQCHAHTILLPGKRPGIHCEGNWIGLQGFKEGYGRNKISCWHRTPDLLAGSKSLYRQFYRKVRV
jgi:hypothetical protein